MPGILHGALLGTYAGKVETLWDRTQGTNIGNWTGNGGLAASFDGNTNQASGSCSARAGVSPCYVGKTISVAAPLSKMVIYGSNNVGHSSAGSAETITWRLYGKNGTPSNETDGTLLASGTFTDTDDNTAHTLTSGDKVTSYTSLWVYISAGLNLFMGEVQIYTMQ